MTTNGDKQRQHHYKSLERPREPIEQAHVNLWATVVHEAVLHAVAGRKRAHATQPTKNAYIKSAHEFFRSRHFSTIAVLIGIDPDAVRKRCLPLQYQRQYSAPSNTTVKEAEQPSCHTL